MMVLDLEITVTVSDAVKLYNALQKEFLKALLSLKVGF